MSNFLPDDYELPTSDGGYMKLENGENRFRIMESPILGYELWMGGKPKRYKMGEDISMQEVEMADVDKATGEPRPPKHFWAFVVWNYKTERLQILEITQKTLQKAITALNRDKDWGNPAGDDGYDIVIHKEGQKFDTEYQVNPKPKTGLATEILEAYKNASINTEALFTGDNPFAKGDAKAKKEKEVNEEDIPF